ncbi:MAG: 2-polyprenyl-3-methyl-6-methoxy-1,4-benzoquinone monooxygenase [Rhodocyclaceae bacterium]|nr:2-polyprenyl-3-methyl-6-methoxy-1,4-benzoquinone monooxygenase [Rhodocyclaceae bacterium]MBL0075042.1 2-polyprenyl-3-methyl-6-methoxy-1,4-benzoquinone monooxygenase [Rhodocyclaceae bacterium]MBP6108776.1 2-polyprenyl-3-methyl-6-methoxy-1,4-benzoquinone monooxygenase [Rhodocyclaceae bacterium]
MFDKLIVEFDKALRTVFANAPTRRAMPGESIVEAEMTDTERAHAAALMRVNHCGEICAQALYQGQALTSKDPEVRQAMEYAAWQETEHLNWTERRITELGGRTSVLNPLWYSGSLAIGILAGKFGDRWNLGFLAETERQVEAHLQAHLERLPAQDMRSREVVAQMKQDEMAHAESAVEHGGVALPLPVRQAMQWSSKIMTNTAYYL